MRETNRPTCPKCNSNFRHIAHDYLCPYREWMMLTPEELAEQVALTESLIQEILEEEDIKNDLRSILEWCDVSIADALRRIATKLEERKI